jgi:hypothetical protein
MDCSKSGTLATKQNQDISTENTYQETEAAGDVKLTSPNNYRAIRYADVLLMAAEAHNKSTTANDANGKYLNEVERELWVIIMTFLLLEQLWLILFKQKEE